MGLIQPVVPPRVSRRRPLRLGRRSMKMGLRRNDRTLRFLSQCFLNALCTCPNTQQDGVKSLAEASSKRNYALCVLCLVFNDSIPTEVCLYAAENFTDHIRLRWSPSSGHVKPIPDTEKCEIMDLILAEISRNPWRLQNRLPEALTIIGIEMDPPQTPLPEFDSVDKMTTGLRGLGLRD